MAAFMTPARGSRSPAPSKDAESLRIAVTGSHGLVGKALVPYLTGRGHQVVRMVRSASHSENEITWDPGRGKLDAEDLEGIDAVIHLAGEPISERWTSTNKQRIRESRVIGTKTLAEALASLTKKPRVFLSGSAIGIYGNRGNEWLDESSAVSNDDFLARVAQEWEAAAEPAARAGIRVVHPRLGIVLHPDGGALERLLSVFRLGAGGKIGSGDQWLSWVARTDAVSALHFLLRDDDFRGPVNVVAPNPETNAQFAKVLGHVISRPAVASVPAIAVRLMLGAEMANATVLSSQRVRPKALDEYGFRFQYPHLEGALRHELSASARGSAA
jgi:uncharacterized protein (TIGR01777 family)